MRYFTEKPMIVVPIYGKTYSCDHPVYSKCTLFEKNGIGLAVIQQRYDPNSKTTWWGELDEWIPTMLYLHENFEKFYVERAGEPIDGLYPTVTVRQMMWAMRIKPLKRERWETCFDRRNI